MKTILLKFDNTAEINFVANIEQFLKQLQALSYPY